MHTKIQEARMIVTLTTLKTGMATADANSFGSAKVRKFVKAKTHKESDGAEDQTHVD